MQLVRCLNRCIDRCGISYLPAHSFRVLISGFCTGRIRLFFIFSAEIWNQRNELVAEYDRIVGAVPGKGRSA